MDDFSLVIAGAPSSMRRRHSASVLGEHTNTVESWFQLEGDGEMALGALLEGDGGILLGALGRGRRGMLNRITPRFRLESEHGGRGASPNAAEDGAAGAAT